MIPPWHDTYNTVQELYGWPDELPTLPTEPLTVTAASTGPIQLNASGGNNVGAFWIVAATNDELLLYRMLDDGTGWEAPTVLVAYTTDVIVRLSLVFDQTGQPMVSIEDAGSIIFYWFDPTLESYTFTNFGAGTYPVSAIDNLENLSALDTELRVWYVNNGRAKYRKQADRFVTVYDASIAGDNLELRSSGVTSQWRYQLVVLADTFTEWPTNAYQ